MQGAMLVWLQGTNKEGSMANYWTIVDFGEGFKFYN